MPLIFERFHHTRDPSHEGAGLGLAIAAEIARRHGVTISVASEEGRGTVFTFAFSRTKHKAKQAACPFPGGRRRFFLYFSHRASSTGQTGSISSVAK